MTLYIKSVAKKIVVDINNTNELKKIFLATLFLATLIIIQLFFFNNIM